MDDNKNMKTVSPELSDEALDQVVGGRGEPDNPCPDCGSTKPAIQTREGYLCPDCGHVYQRRIRIKS